MSNAHTFRITADAGTKLPGIFNNYYCISHYLVKFTTYLPSILHEVLLYQSCLHCTIFLTAASYEFRSFLSSNAAVQSLNSAKRQRLGKLLISPTTT